MDNELQDRIVLSGFLALLHHLRCRYIWDMYRWKTGDTYSTNSSLFVGFVVDVVETLYTQEARSDAIRKAQLVRDRIVCGEQAFNELPPWELRKAIQATIKSLDTRPDTPNNQEWSYEEYIKQMDY